MPAELTVRDGYLTPRDLPQGDCIITSLYGDDGTQAGIRIDHADPRVLISAELLETIARQGAATVPDADGMAFPLGAQLDMTDCCDCLMQDDYTLAVLKISAVNRTVIYRITEYVPAVHGYIAEWPD